MEIDIDRETETEAEAETEIEIRRALSECMRRFEKRRPAKGYSPRLSPRLPAGIAFGKRFKAFR